MLFLYFVNERIKTMTPYFRTAISIIVLFSGSMAAAAGQDADSLVRKADSLRKAYMFEESMALYDEALSLTRDSVARISLEDAKMLSENGLGMADFVLSPAVVARHRFSLDEFWLYYPLEDRSWRPVPNVLDTLGTHPFYRAVYFPERCTSLYYSSPDTGGAMNIYRTDRKDSTWSAPSLLNEYLVSSSDEIYPMLSPDGRKLFFASSGLYGMGGFDLYVSTWNEEQHEWGPPSNMGMPFSSPYNDFLYMDTPDGRYSIFASDRGCPPDSVDIYVLEQETMPVRKGVDDPDMLRKIMSLEPEEDIARFDEGPAMSRMQPEDADTREYTAKVAEVRNLRDSMYAANVRIDTRRTLLAENPDAAGRERLEQEISEAETRIQTLQDSLEKASAALQDIEMEFLFKGIVLDPDKLVREADREVEGAETDYVFTRMDPGRAPDIVLEKPPVKFDYTFMILPEGRFAEDNTLPDGIVYQIQMFSLSSRAAVKSLKGLSPVFEEITPSGKYVYRVGVFRTYNDVLSNLNTVKKLGFRTAFITAFNDGEAVPVSKARALEKQPRAVSLYQIDIVPYDGTLPELVVSAIGQLCGKKDIARTEKDGKITYIVGPFDDRSLVEKVMVAVRAAGVEDVTYVRIGNGEEQQ